MNLRPSRNPQTEVPKEFRVKEFSQDFPSSS